MPVTVNFVALRMRAMPKSVRKAFPEESRRIVAVENAATVRVIQRLGHLTEYREGFPDREIFPLLGHPGHAVLKGPGVDEFHHHVIGVFRRFVIEDLDDAGMAHRRHRLGFALEAGQKAFAVRQVPVENLHRNVPVEGRMPGFVHLGHPAAAEKLHQLVLSDGFSNEIGHDNLKVSNSEQDPQGIVLENPQVLPSGKPIRFDSRPNR
jgi:hypothetical protein